MTRRLGILSMAVACACVALLDGRALAQQPEPAGEAPKADTAAPAPAAAPAPELPDIVEQQRAPAGDATANLKRYDAKFSEIEEQIQRIKEDVFGSKTRLMLLREQILHNVVAESRLVLVHENDMGMGYTLKQVVYYLDGGKIYFAQNDKGQLDDKRRFVIYDGTIVPGSHVLSVQLTYEGSGGLFTYVSGYRFTLESSFTFFAAKGKILQVNATGFEKGGLLARFEEKPAVRYTMKQVRYTKENLDAILKELQ